MKTRFVVALMFVLFPLTGFALDVCQVSMIKQHSVLIESVKTGFETLQQKDNQSEQGLIKKLGIYHAGIGTSPSRG